MMQEEIFNEEAGRESPSSNEDVLLADAAARSVLAGTTSFCKFLSANDTGLTGAHQSGIYIPKNSYSLLFDTPGCKGSNRKETARIRWQDGSDTESSFTYYGTGTRDEYRITRFGRGFEYLQHKYTGALFVITRRDKGEYEAFVLNTDDQINRFLDNFCLSPADTNTLISTKPTDDFLENEAFQEFIASLQTEFPDSRTMSAAAREIEERIHDHSENIIARPDEKLLEWIRIEYDLFRTLERARYLPQVQKGFKDIDDFVTAALKVLNSRKSRAGKSLEHHLSAIFLGNHLTFEEQVKTEGNKTVDFLFPSSNAYHDFDFDSDRLVTLAAKTTCKDRWRQILNEADRLRNGSKYLCTLQRGISPQQLAEMKSEGVVLVVPERYVKEYPPEFRSGIWTVKRFISFVQSMHYLA